MSAIDQRDLNHARRVVAEHFGVVLGDFPVGKSQEQTGDATEDGERSGWSRYKVSKADLERLFAVPMKGKGAGKRFADAAVSVITSSQEAGYDGYHSDVGDSVLLSMKFNWKEMLPRMGAASRLFLWLHWRQAEARDRLRTTAGELADALGVDKRTVQTHKKILVDMGLLAVDDRNGSWTVKYEPENSGN